MTGSLMMVGLVMGLGMWRSGETFLQTLRTLVTPTEPEPQVDIQSLVVQQVRGASELTTAIFAMQAVVPTRRDRTFAGYTVGTTTLLYIAHGEVRAGVDLSQLQREDVQRVGNTLRLQLPPPQILDSKIDVNRSKVYDYDRGFLGLGPDVAPDLQQAAQQQTLQTIVETACAEGILQEANDRAKLAVTQLLSTLNSPIVSVETQPPTPGTCPQPKLASTGASESGSLSGDTPSGVPQSDSIAPSQSPPLQEESTPIVIPYRDRPSNNQPQG